MKNTLKKLAALLLTLSLLLGLNPVSLASAEAVDVSELYKKKDVTATWEDAEAVHITLSGTAASADADTGWSAADGVLTISAEGTYVLSGEWSGQIAVNTDEEAKVRLILSGVTVTSPAGPALYETCADKLILTLAEGTVNTFSDTAAITVTDPDDGSTSEVGAAIWAEDDLSVNGAGTLIVNGNVKHGLLSRADLIIAGGSYEITAVNDGVRGRNSVLILDGRLTITSQGDGITSTRTSKEGKGWIVIAGGEISITAGGGAASSAQAETRGWSRGWDDWGSSGASASEDTVSAKGVKAAADLTVQGGTLNIDSLDDALHAVNVTVADGSLILRSGDDGIHADEALSISGGSIDLQQSYEGLEAQHIAISGGEISVTASDDGLNATASSSTSASAAQGWGMNAVEDADIVISGGTLHVNASGDGIDSNGQVSMTGGTVTVSGPTNSGNGALDYNGTFALSGGTLIAAGAAGMAQNVTSAENQAAIMISLGGTAAAGAEIQVLNAEGEVILSFTPEKQYQIVVVSSPEIQVGSAYTVTVGGTAVYSGTVTSAVEGGGGSFGGWGGRGGQQGGFGGQQGGQQGGWGPSGGGRGR